MSDPQLLKKVAERNTPFTKELTDGWFKRDLDEIVPYYDKILKTMLSGLKEKGYIIDRVERVCPIEFYNGITRNNTGSGTKDFETSRNTFFGVRIVNHFVDPETGVEEELKNPLIFLPYTNEYGDIYARNNLYSLQYVLSERGPSVDGTQNDKTIFIRVLGYKFKVTKEVHVFNRVYKITETNHRTTAMHMTLPANRFQSSKNDRKIVSTKVPIPLLAWYVFGKYGFSHSMYEFADCEFVIDTYESLLEHCKEDDGWEIYINNGSVNPKAFQGGWGGGCLVEPGIAVRSRTKGGIVNNLALQYVGGLLFMFSVFNCELDIRRLDDIDYWRYIIGRCSIKLPDSTPPEAYLRQINEHFFSVEEYADEITLDKYKNFDIDVKDTYSLFNYLLLNYSNLIKLYNPADMLHKELASKEFLIDSLVKRISDFKFTIRNKSNITPKIINDALGSCFTLFAVDSTVRENNTILEQTGTDNPFIDYGLGIILQTKSSVSTAGKKSPEFDPRHPGSAIDASQPFVVSYQFASKPSPDARGTMQPRVHLVHGKYISLRPEDRTIYENTKHRLKFKE